MARIRYTLLIDIIVCLIFIIPLPFLNAIVEVPLQLLLSAGEAPAVVQQATQDLVNNFAVLEDHIKDRTYLVGETLSVSDVSLFVAYLVAVEKKFISTTSFSALNRWARSISVNTSIKAFVDEKLPLLRPTTGRRVVTTTVAGGAGGWDRHRIRVKELLQEGEKAIGKEVIVKGWVRTSRSADKGLLLFVELTDGSSVRGLQLVMNTSTTEGVKDIDEAGGVGVCLSAVGTVVSSPATGQAIEVHVTSTKLLGAVYGGDNGEVGGKNYPMAKKKHTLEFLREKAHLRPRSKVFSSAMRVRHAMAFATHKFFNDRGFVYVHTPLITAADCEGAGEQFVVSTLLGEDGKVASIPTDKQGKIDYSKDFFGRRCCLTVSGQLNVETHACALSDVYTFGPTFRAENSHTARHLAEFWMIEPEICFADLVDDMALAVMICCLLLTCCHSLFLFQ